MAAPGNFENKNKRFYNSFISGKRALLVKTSNKFDSFKKLFRVIWSELFVRVEVPFKAEQTTHRQRNLTKNWLESRM